MAGLKFDIEVNLSKIDDITTRLDKLQRKLESIDKHSSNFKHIHREFEKLKAELKSLQAETDKLQRALSHINLSKKVLEDSKKARKGTDEASSSVRNYTDSLESLRAEMKKVSAEIKNMSGVQRKSEEGGNAKRKYGELRGSLNAAAEEMRRYANEHKKMLEVERSAEGSLKQLRAQLSLLNADYDGLSRKMRNGAAGKALLGQIQEVTKELNEAEQASMRFYRNVGNYGSAWNGLNVQTQQLVRELPSLAVSANTFFLAISNNLPMFVDEIKRAKDELAALKAEGKKGTPVWKQLASSIFSWQTALVVGLTVLSTKGKDIAKWMGGLFKGSSSNKTKTEIEAIAEAQKSVNEVMKLGSTEYGEQAGKLISLSAEWKNLGDNLKAKKKFIDENQGAFDDLGVAINGVNDAEKLLRDNTDGFLEAISARAQSTAAFKKVAELAEEALRVELELEEVKNEKPGYWDRMGATMSYANTGSGTQQIETAEDYRKRREQNLQSELKDIHDQMDAYSKLGVKKKQEYVKGLGDLAKEGKKNEEKASKDYSSSLENIRRDSEDREIELMKEGTEKQLKEINVRYQREKDEVMSLEKELRESQGGKLTQDQESVFTKSYESIDRSRESEIQQVNDEEAKARKEREEAEEAANNEYLRKYGEFLEKRKALKEYYDKEIANAETEGEAMIKGKEYEKALDDLDKELMESSDLWGGMFSDFSNRSSSAIRGLIADIEKLIQYMEGVEGAEMPDMFKDNKKTVDAINKAMSDPKTAKKFSDALRGEITKFKKMLDEDNPFTLIKDGFKEKDSESMAKGFSKISAAVGQLQTVMADLGVEADSTAGKVMSVVGKGASYAATGASIGGPWGAAIGGALGVASGLAGLFGADYSQYEKMKEEYEGLIDVWDILIDRKKEYISENYGIEAAKVGKEAMSLLQKESDAWRKLGKERLNSGSSAGSHSIGVRQRKRMDEEDWKQAEAAVGKGVLEGRQIGLFDLTAEQLKKLQEEAPSFWAKMDDEVREYLENIIEGAERLEEMQDAIREQLTGITFDSMYNSFVDNLMNMEYSAEDAANNISDMFMRAMINNQIGAAFNEKLKDWYDLFAKAMENGTLEDEFMVQTRKPSIGHHSEWEGTGQTEMEYLMEEYQKMVEEAMKIRDELANATGYGKDETFKQEATSKGFNAMSQEVGNELNGRFTAMYESDLRREAIMSEQLAIMRDKAPAGPSDTSLDGTIRNIQMDLQGLQAIAEESRDVLVSSFMELQTIREINESTVKSVRKIDANVESVTPSLSRL